MRYSKKIRKRQKKIGITVSDVEMKMTLNSNNQSFESTGVAFVKGANKRK